MARELPLDLLKVRKEESLSVRDRGGENIMRSGFQRKSGTELMLEKYIAIFRTPENQNHYSKEDYQVAERKFLEYALEHGSTELREKLSNR